MSPAHPGDLRLVAGAVCLDFCNNVAWRTSPSPVDRVGDYDRFLAWSVHAGTVPAELAWALRAAGRRCPEEAAAAYARAVTLRASITAVFDAIATGSAPAGADLDACLAAYRDALGFARLRVDGYGGWVEWPRDAVFDRVLWPLSYSAWTLLTSEHWPRIRRCDGTGCGWLFIDDSRNASRRWCSDRDCGRRERVRSHRARQS